MPRRRLGTLARAALVTLALASGVACSDGTGHGFDVTVDLDVQDQFGACRLFWRVTPSDTTVSVSWQLGTFETDVVATDWRSSGTNTSTFRISWVHDTALPGDTINVRWQVSADGFAEDKNAAVSCPGSWIEQ